MMLNIALLQGAKTENHELSHVAVRKKTDAAAASPGLKDSMRTSSF